MGAKPSDQQGELHVPLPIKSQPPDHFPKAVSERRGIRNPVGIALPRRLRTIALRNLSVGYRTYRHTSPYHCAVAGKPDQRNSRCRVR